MSNYTKADQDTLDNANIRDSVYPKFQEKLVVCRNVFFYHYNYLPIFSDYTSDVERASLIQCGINHILKFSEDTQLDVTTRPISKAKINEQINELLHQSIYSDEVVNLFQDFENGFSLFD